MNKSALGVKSATRVLCMHSGNSGTAVKSAAVAASMHTGSRQTVDKLITVPDEGGPTGLVFC